MLSALCAWLVGRRYLDSNPWEGVPTLRVAQAHIDVERAVPDPVWHALAAWLDGQADNDAYWRTVRAALLLLHDSTQACGCLKPRRPIGLGCGRRPVTARCGASCRSSASAPSCAWCRSVGMPMPRSRRTGRTGRGGPATVTRGLRHLVDRAGGAFRAWLGEHHAELARHALFLHPHAFRHAFGTAATEAGVPLDVVQSYLGHVSPSTTAIYNKAGARRRQGEIRKLYGPR
ncbi:tyrosine-type recombinase/integrase [Ralstonia pseudosolanacearum]